MKNLRTGGKQVMVVKKEIFLKYFGDVNDSSNYTTYTLVRKHQENLKKWVSWSVLDLFILAPWMISIIL